MTLTKKDKRKLAKAARELASDYAEGRGPELTKYSWCGCAAGQIFTRAGIDNRYGQMAARLDASVGLVLTGATARQIPFGAEKPLPGAVVFPLLYLADVLEEAAR